MLINMVDILKEAKDRKYAIAQFNINNLEWTRFILEECNKLNIPVILGVSEGALKYMGGYITVANMVKNLIKYLDVGIPVVLHLDHGSSVESCKNAIEAGFSSVMIDASKYDLDENIRITKEVVDYAHDRNISVEAEVGHVGDDNIDIMYAKVEDCIRFCNETNVDALAPALGSVHGPYKGEPKLDFDRMKQICELCNIPLVLHGGSGIYDEQIKEAISCGICKINFNTELQQAWTLGVRNKLNEDNTVYDPRKVILSGESNLKQVIDDKTILLGTTLASDI